MSYFYKVKIKTFFKVNPIINAIAAERYEGALEEARQVDALIAAGLSDDEARKKPFLGS